MDVMVWVLRKERRHKKNERCDEYYSNFIVYFRRYHLSRELRMHLSVTGWKSEVP